MLPAPAPEQIRTIVQTELERFGNIKLKQNLETFLIEPYLQKRLWGKRYYQQIACWIVADFQVEGFGGKGVGVAYSHEGHGENGYFWNLVFLRDEGSLDTGNNNCYRTLEELAADSGYCD